MNLVLVRREEDAYHAERQRIRGSGQNPNPVIWVLKNDELALIDIRSVDAGHDGAQQRTAAPIAPSFYPPWKHFI